MKCKWWFSGPALALMWAQCSVSLGLDLHVTQIGQLPPAERRSVYSTGEELLISTWGDGPGEFVRYNGISFTPMNNSSQARGPVGNDCCVPLDGELWFSSRGSNGGSLFRTDGQDIRFVLDLDPGSDTNSSWSLYGAGGYVYFQQNGLNGRELARTNGSMVQEFDLNPGPGDASVYAAEAFGDELFFRVFVGAVVKAYRADAGGVHDLRARDYYQAEDAIFYVDTDRGLYRHDSSGTHLLAQLPEVSGRPFPQILFANNEVVAVQDTSVDAHVWDGAEFRSYGPPVGAGALQVEGGIGSTVLFSARGLPGLFKPDGDQLAPLPSGVAGEVSVLQGQTIGDSFVFMGRGAYGKELYRTDGDTIEILIDANPTGDGFPLSSVLPFAWNGVGYFAAYSPETGNEFYRTDGVTAWLIEDATPGPEGTMSNFGRFGFGVGGFPLVVLEGDQEVSGLLAPRLFLSDGHSMVSIDDLVGAPLAYAYPLAEFQGDLVVLGAGGEVFRIAIVPEPMGAGVLVVAAHWPLLVRRRW